MKRKKMNWSQSTASVLLLLATGSAQAGRPSAAIAQGPGTDTQEAISAQVNVIRDSVNVALRRIDNRKPDSSFKSADYWQQLPSFKKTVELVMNRFQERMGDERNGILGRVATEIERYNAVATSPSLTPEQKEIILERVYANMQKSAVSIRQDYASAVASVFTTVFPSIPFIAEAKINGLTSNTAESFGCRYTRRYRQNMAIEIVEKQRDGKVCSKKTKRGEKREQNNGPLLGVFKNTYHPFVMWWDPKLTNDVDYATSFYPFISSGCNSQICLGMRAGDLVFALGLIQTTINRQITVRLTGTHNRTLELPPVELDLNWVSSMLSKTSYPVELPFDTQ